MPGTDSSPSEPKRKPPPVLITEGSELTPSPIKNGDREAKTGQARVWGFTVNELTNVLFQVLATIIASVFGAWAIKSYESANIANELSKSALSQGLLANDFSDTALQQTLFANQLAILALCQTDLLNPTPECSAARTAIQQLLPIMMSSIIPSFSISYLPTGTVTPTSLPLPDPTWVPIILPPPDPTLPDKASSGADNISLGGIIGIIAGSVVFIAVIGLIIVGRRRARICFKGPSTQAEP